MIPQFECLEDRLVLDGSGSMPPPPVFAPPIDLAPADQDLIDIQNQVVAIVATAGTPMGDLAIPSFLMYDKAAEIQRINDLRDQFNAAVNSIIGINLVEIGELTMLSAQIDTKIAALNWPADQAKIEKASQLQSEINADISDLKTQNENITTFQDYVNGMVDEIILDIKGTVFTMDGVNYSTYYTNDAFTV
jgi:hypothetical protein